MAVAKERVWIVVIVAVLLFIAASFRSHKVRLKGIGDPIDTPLHTRLTRHQPVPWCCDPAFDALCPTAAAASPTLDADADAMPTGAGAGQSFGVDTEIAASLVAVPMRYDTPIPECFFLAWTTGNRLDAWRWLVVGSIFRYHPDARVIIYATNTIAIDTDPLATHIRAAGFALEVRNMDLVAIARGSPVQRWTDRIDEWKTGPHFYSHQTDAFRFAVLHRYGGVYMDFDVLLMRSVTSLNSTVLGRQGADLVNGALMAFPRGHVFITLSAMRMADWYDPNEWATIGPHIITSSLDRLAAADSDLVVELTPLLQRQEQELQKLRDSGVVTPLPTPPPAASLVPAARSSRINFHRSLVYPVSSIYPVYWERVLDSKYVDATEEGRAAYRAIASDPNTIAYHIFTRMYKMHNRKFQLNPGSFLHEMAIHHSLFAEEIIAAWHKTAETPT